MGTWLVVGHLRYWFVTDRQTELELLHSVLGLVAALVGVDVQRLHAGTTPGSHTAISVG